MPIYEYACDDCGHEFELVRKFSDSSIPSCEQCAKGRVVKKLSRSAFMLKGGGWYKEGYSGPSNDEKKTGSSASESSKAASSNGSDKNGGESTTKKDAASSSTGDSGKTASTGSSTPSSTPPSASS